MGTTAKGAAAGHGRASRALAGLVVFAAAVLLSGACAGDSADGEAAAEPWGAQTVRPADLVKELAGSDKPVVVCVAPPSMYSRAHIPAAVLHGPASEPAALAQLTAWAQPLPRTTRLVVYCGCCPVAYCPNLRPAFNALKGMGFTHLRVLVLPENFGTDWVERGYPVER
jgi:hypothetical protein